MPDPCARETLERSTIDWSKQADPYHAGWLEHCRNLLAVRVQEITPRLGRPPGAPASFQVEGDLLRVEWSFGGGDRLTLLALLADAGRRDPCAVEGRPIWTSKQVVLYDGALGELPPWFVGWFLRS